MSDSTPDIHDHTIVWAVHAGIEYAGQMPRSALAVDGSGWKEVKDTHPKVTAALAAGASVPATEDVAAEPTSPSRASTKEK